MNPALEAMIFSNNMICLRRYIAYRAAILAVHPPFSVYDQPSSAVPEKGAGDYGHGYILYITTQGTAALHRYGAERTGCAAHRAAGYDRGGCTPG